MKKKIIISLILAMCCVLIAIPVSAKCLTCGSFYEACSGKVIRDVQATHYYFDEYGSEAECTFYKTGVRSIFKCNTCHSTHETMISLHNHGWNTHECGKADHTVCSLVCTCGEH